VLVVVVLVVVVLVLDLWWRSAFLEGYAPS
jgi:hypothetical protein